MAKPFSDSTIDVRPLGPANALAPLSAMRNARHTYGQVRAPSSDLTFLFKARHRRWYAWQRRIDQRRKVVEHVLSAPVVVNPTALPLADQRLIRTRLAGRTRREAPAFRVPHSVLRPPPKIILIPAIELKFRTIQTTLSGRTRREMVLRAPHSRLRAPKMVQGSSLPVFETVTASGGAAAAAAIANPSPVLIRAPHWRFVVTTLQHRTLTFLDDIAYKRSVVYTLNKASTATGVVDSDNPEIFIAHTDEDAFLSEGNRFLLGFRREGLNPKWVIRFAGIILQIEDSVEGDTPKSTFTAYDPWEYLNHRPCRKADGSLPGEAGMTFAGQRGDEIAHALIRHTIEQDGPIHADIGALGGTPFYSGTLQSTAPIDITFAQGATVGEALTALCETGTIDIYFSPIYDPFNRPGYISELNIYNMMGHKEYGSVMGWDKTARNLTNISRLTDGSQRANVVQYFRSNSIPVGPVSDVPSYTKYGKYWDTQTFQSEYPVSAVEQLAQESVLVHKDRPQTIRVTPAPEIAPVPFIEYFLGDQVPLVASKRFRQPMYSLARIYSIPIDIDDNSLEKVQSLEFSADSLTELIFGDVPPSPGGGGTGGGGESSAGFSPVIIGGTDPGDTLSVTLIPT